MTKRSIDVKKIREIIRFSETCNINQRRIARELNIPRPIVNKYLNYFSTSRITYEQIKSMTDNQILAFFEKQKNKNILNELETKIPSPGEENIEVTTAYPILSRIEFVKRIHEKQEKIKDYLEINNSGLSVWTKTPTGKILSKGCQSCKSGRWLCLFVGKKCNVDCLYCPQGTKQEKMIAKERSGFINDKYHIEELKDILNDPGEIWTGSNIQGIAYSGGEPFLYLDKVLDLVKFISKYYNHIYQWIYTNGSLVTKDKLKALHDEGIKEIRFHLGATNFNKDVLKKLEMAKGIMEYVNVETPSNPELKEFLINKKGIYLLEGIGVYQINLGELSGISIYEMDRYPLGFKRMLEYFRKYGGLYLYDSVIGKSVIGKDLSEIYISPIISREITYDIMEYAIENSIDILINDCSLDAKHIQRLQRNFFEHYMDMLIANSFQYPDYIRELQEDINENINENKLNMIMEHNRYHSQDRVKSLIQDFSYKDERGYHLKLGELVKLFDDSYIKF